MPFEGGLHNRYRIVLINTGNGQDTPETNGILRFYTTSIGCGYSLSERAVIRADFPAYRLPILRAKPSIQPSCRKLSEPCVELVVLVTQPLSTVCHKTGI